MADTRQIVSWLDNAGVGKVGKEWKDNYAPRWLAEIVSGIAGIPGDAAVLGRKIWPGMTPSQTPENTWTPPTQEQLRPRFEKMFGYVPPPTMAEQLGINDIPGYAEGGRYPVGQDIVVGENGPEVVHFDQPGTVIPSWL